MKKDFFLNIPTRVYFETGCSLSLGDLLERQGWRQIGLVIDHNLKELSAMKDMLLLLEEKCDEIKLSYCTSLEPTYNCLEEMRKQFCDERLEVVIGIGGGSAIDMAKAMAVLVHNKLPAIDYRGFDKMQEPVLPIVAIPTTAGTGTEVTPNASFVDSVEKKKMGINGEAVRPQYAFLDPELTLSCPLKPTISAAVDSIVHATEAYVAQKSNPIAKFFAKEGFKLVAQNLPLLVEDLSNLDYRTEVMYGAFLSGVALMHSGTGPSAALSYPLGVHYRVPHGIGGAVFLSSVVKINIEGGYFGYSGLVEGYPDITFESEEEGAAKFLRLIESVLAFPEVRNSLSSVKLDHEIMISETMQLIGALEQNPIPFGECEIKKAIELVEK
jgi:alcohol dehydrogenase class IV